MTLEDFEDLTVADTSSNTTLTSSPDVIQKLREKLKSNLAKAYVKKGNRGRPRILPDRS